MSIVADGRLPFLADTRVDVGHVEARVARTLLQLLLWDCESADAKIGVVFNLRD